MMSLASQPWSSTPGSVAAQARQAMMLNSAGGQDKWLMDEIVNYNVPVKRRKFPKEASRLLRDTMDETLSMALSLHHSSPLAFSAYSLFVLFPRLLLRPLPDGCQGSFAAATLSRRCRLLKDGEVGTLLNEAHEAQRGRVAKQTASHSKLISNPSFANTARAAILAGAGAMGRA